MLNFTDTKRKSLERRLTAAVEEWTALTEELTHNRDAVARLRIKRQIDQLEAEIQEIESDLKALVPSALAGPPVAQKAVVNATETAASSAKSENTSEAEPLSTPIAATPETGTDLKVFLCHGNEDKAAVRQLYNRLKADGVDPWLDAEDIMPGRNWEREIRRAVRDSHVVLVCLSSLTVQKESFIQKEIKQALDVMDEQPEETIYLIPVRLEACEIPDRLRAWQWVDYFSANGYGKLMWALKHRAGEIGVVLRSAGDAASASASVPVMRPTVTSTLADGSELIYVPAGEFVMGSTEAQVEVLLQSDSSYKREWFTRELPQHRIYLDAYSISKTPVTVAQYLAFCTATGHPPPAAPSFNPKWQHGDHPIVNVRWADATAYCAWLSARTGLHVTLPTEAQWEKASRGMDGREYPWGNEWNAGLCVNRANSETGTCPVGSKPAGASPYGVLDMAGNVWEWCADWFDADYYQGTPSRNPLGPETGDFRVLRGGSWYNNIPNFFRCACRSGSIPGLWYDFAGFRCAVRSDPL